MISKICLLIILLLPLTGCIAIPDDKFAERIDFNYMPPDHKPMSYDDVLCCYRCEA